MGVVLSPLLPDRDMFPRCFDLGFHEKMAASKSTIRQNGRAYGGTRLSKYIMGTCVLINKPCFEYMLQCEFYDMTAHITEHVSNVTWTQNVFP